MKIKQVENRINASYNTIKKFVETDTSYYEINDRVIHVSKIGLEKLEKKYGLKSEILSDQEMVFYKTQLKFMEQQLYEFKQYNQLFLKQIESNGELISDREQELEKKKNEIDELKKELLSKELDVIELKHKLDLEKSKSIFKKIFRK